MTARATLLTEPERHRSVHNNGRGRLDGEPAHRKLILYVDVAGWLRRVHVIPVLLGGDTPPCTSLNSSISLEGPTRWRPLPRRTWDFAGCNRR